jgi:hypothetical protein
MCWRGKIARLQNRLFRFAVRLHASSKLRGALMLVGHDAAAAAEDAW